MLPIETPTEEKYTAMMLSQKITVRSVLMGVFVCLSACTEDKGFADTPLDAGLTQSDAHEAPDAQMVVDAGVDAHQILDTALGQDSMLSADMGLPIDGQTPDMLMAMDGAGLRDSAILADAVRPDAAATPESFDQMVQRVLAAHGVSRMGISLPEVEVHGQSAMYAGVVDFETALNAAIVSFLTDGTDIESPLSLLADTVGGPCPDPSATERVRCYMNQATTRFELYGDTGFAPENGESIQGNWIFILMAETLSDHIQWAIIDRSGAFDAYNYGFN
jgi:hypothetical protein